MYDDDDIYGDSSGLDDDLAGLTIVGNDFGSIDGDDPAALWLAQQEASAESSGDGASYQDELIGAATPEALQLGRISHVEPRIQAGIKHVLEGGSLRGTHPVDLAAAREEFGSVIGGDPSAFARQIRLDEAVGLPRHEQDIKTVMSMLGNTAGTYMDRGPGGQLINTYADEERQAKADSDFGIAVGYVKELADMYLDDRTRGSSVEGARRLALEESITKRLIDGTFYEGSSSLLPLPNETGVTGIKATQGIYGSAQGTAMDRMGAAKNYDDLYQSYMQGQKTKFVRDDRGFKVFKSDVPEHVRSEVLRNTPSLANSLFPKPLRVRDKTYSQAELDKQSRDQKYAMSQAQTKADFARRILRQQMPTTRDESKGQMRMSGWDTPYDEQADLQNLRNEAAIQGIDWNTAYTGQGGASRGASLQSELGDYLADEQAKEDTLSRSGQTGVLVQGSQEWLNIRKGKITASTAAGLLKEGGVEQRALDLAMERLGTAEKFMGNAHTLDGNRGEPKALAAFLSGPGRGLTQTEEGFIENPKYAGFGISPDGLLWNGEGESEGLLELKYLSSGSMKGALNKYTPQMQMQMAITGEEQTHFYALDKYTGEYVHEVVKADPEMQAQLIKAGTQALELGASLDNRGVRDLRKEIQSAAKPRKKLGLKEEAGQTAAFVSTDAVEEEMTAFDPTAATVSAVAAITESGGSPASATKLAQKLEQDDQRARMKDAMDAAQPEEGIKYDKVQNQREQAKARNEFVDAQRQTAFGDGADNSDMASFYKQQQAEAMKAEKEKQAAQRETTDNLRNFGNALKEASGVAAELGALVTGGNASGMREVRTAAEAGLSTAEARGMREALELGGLDQAGSDRVISQAGQLQRTFNDQEQAAGQFTQFMEARGKSNLAGVKNLQMPSLAEFKAMSPQQMTARVASMMQGKTSEERSAIANIFNMPELAVYAGEASAITDVDTSINEQNIRETYTGITKVEQLVREGREQIGEVGEFGGMAGAAAGVVAGVAGSKTLAATSSKASAFMANAAKSSPKIASAVKTASVAAKASPMAIVAGAAPMAIRALTDVQDDGTLGDSALDVMEFAAYGAAAGSIVPGVGTALGAGVGAAVGVANEAWEWFNADDAVPKADIGLMQSQTKEQSTGKSQDVHVSVVNEISPELITTTTDVNGDISVDSDSSLSTGG